METLPRPARGSCTRGSTRKAPGMDKAWPWSCLLFAEKSLDCQSEACLIKLVAMRLALETRERAHMEGRVGCVSQLLYSMRCPWCSAVTFDSVPVGSFHWCSGRCLAAGSTERREMPLFVAYAISSIAGFKLPA